MGVKLNCVGDPDLDAIIKMVERNHRKKPRLLKLAMVLYIDGGEYGSELIAKIANCSRRYIALSLLKQKTFSATSRRIAGATLYRVSRVPDEQLCR